MHGIFPALVTPLQEHETVDIAALNQLAAFSFPSA
jgi:dihydrodipicolinate synthase/N-acetylneuraminate lyase